MNKIKNIPLGCKTLHFPKKIGKSWVCMYCGKVVTKPKLK